MRSAHDPCRNQLLAALPADEYSHLLPHLEYVFSPLGSVLYEQSSKLRHVYFPTNSLVSLSLILEDGSATEVAMVGREGIVGLSLFMGAELSPGRATVRSEGILFRLPAALLKERFNRAGPLQRLFLRYTQALLTQIAQTAVCNRHHSLEQQLCRHILINEDQLRLGRHKMTQEQIANTLGVRREGVTAAAGKLQRDGLIEYSRGYIDVCDREGLEDRCCECYAVVNKEIARLLPAETAE